MPVTPDFSVSQDDAAVVVRIRVPHVRVSEAEVSLDGQDFTFWCRPYLLNLTLPCALLPDDGDNCHAKYLPDECDGTIVATLPKQEHGQHFPGLDLATSLLRVTTLPPLPPDRNENQAPSIEVLSSDTFGGEDDSAPASEKQVEEEGEGSVTTVKEQSQAPSSFASAPRATEYLESGSGGGGGSSSSSSGGVAGLNIAGLSLHGSSSSSSDSGSSSLVEPTIALEPPRYGFQRRFRGVFRHLREEASEALDARFSPEFTPESDRWTLREAAEDDDFDCDRYMGDEHFGTLEDPLYLEAIAYAPHWCTIDYSKSGIRPSEASPPAPPPSSSSSSAAAAAAAAEPHVAPSSSSQAVLSQPSPLEASSELLSERKETLVATPLVTPLIAEIGSNDGATPAKAAKAAKDDEDVAPVATTAAPIPPAPTSSSAPAEGDGESALLAPLIWSPAESDAMQRLQNREFLMDENEFGAAFATIFNILVAYAYDQRLTCGEGSVESAWTISKLSASLHWLEGFHSCTDWQATAEASLWSSIRRILCYPYLRAHTAALLCCRDACTIVQLGRRCVLRCLLHVQATLATANDHQGYYLLNKVMVSDACVWVQQVSDRHWNQFSTALGAAMVAVEQKGIATGVGGKMATQIAKAEAALAAEMASDSDDEEDESESSEDDSSEDNS